MRHGITVFLLSTLSFLAPAQTDTNLYSFFIAGHASGTPGVDNVGLHPDFKKQFPYIKGRNEIELGFLTGDVIRAFPGPTVQDWIEVDADIDSIGIPVQIAVGNHDMEDRPIFEQRYGTTYYSFVQHNDLFMVLDPNIDGWKITGNQLEFLKDTLNKYENQVDNIYLFFHQVIWKETNNGFDHIFWNSQEGKNGQTNFWPELYPIFSKLNHSVYLFAGDVGAASYATSVSYDKYENMTLITSGMGNGTDENYIVINVDSSKNLTYDLICLQENNPNCLGKLTDHLEINIINSNESPKTKLSLIRVTNSSITVELLNSEKYNYEVYNLNGQLISKANNIDQGVTQLSIKDYKQGVYFISVFTQSGKEIHKFVK